MATSRSWQMANILHSTATSVTLVHQELEMFLSPEAEGLYWHQESVWSRREKQVTKTGHYFQGHNLVGSFWLTSHPVSAAHLLSSQGKAERAEMFVVSELAKHFNFGWVPWWDGFRMIQFCITIPDRAGYTLTLRALLCAGIHGVTAWRAGIMWYRLPSLRESCAYIVSIITVSEQHVL